MIRREGESETSFSSDVAAVLFCVSSSRSQSLWTCTCVPFCLSVCLSVCPSQVFDVQFDSTSIYSYTVFVSTHRARDLKIKRRKLLATGAENCQKQRHGALACVFSSPTRVPLKDSLFHIHSRFGCCFQSNTKPGRKAQIAE
jgi:hypothetical protein